MVLAGIRSLRNPVPAFNAEITRLQQRIEQLQGELTATMAQRASESAAGLNTTGLPQREHAPLRSAK